MTPSPVWREIETAPTRCVAMIWTRSTNQLHTARRQCSRNAAFGDFCRQHSNGTYPRWTSPPPTQEQTDDR
jgi:hypothetical protein